MGEAAIKIEKEIESERKNGAIVFLPSAIVPESFYRPVVERICLSDDDIYESQKKYRIRYDGLLKLANAAGIEWSPVDSGRTDNGGDKLYVSFRAVGLIRKADGKLYPTAASYDLDLELVKEELDEQYRQKAAGMRNKSQNEKEDYIRYCVTRDWLHKRKHKATLAESGAKARVIRSVLGLPSQYTNKNDIVGRPFVLVRFVLDHQNPDIKQTMLTAARENMSSIFGHGSLPPALPRFDSAASDENVIDLPHQPEPEDDLPPEPPEGTGNPYGGDYSTEADGGLVDFENSDPETQVKTLTHLFTSKGEDLRAYLKRAKVNSLHQLPSKTKIDLFIYLKKQGGNR